MKSDNFQMVIEIKTHSGAVLKPHEIHFWDPTSKNNPKHLQDLHPNSPFKFFTDAILGLCYHKMTDYKSMTAEQKNFSENNLIKFHGNHHGNHAYEVAAKNFRSIMCLKKDSAAANNAGK